VYLAAYAIVKTYGETQNKENSRIKIPVTYRDIWIEYRKARSRLDG